MSRVKLLTSLNSPRRRLVTAAVAILVAALGATLTAWGSGNAQPNHGSVVARLPMPFRPHAERGIELIPVSVNVGQRFSILVGTTVAFPAYWTETGSSPDARIVQAVGDFSDGSCGDMIGCAVPYFHTLSAQSRGTTTMTWQYRTPECRRFKHGGGGPAGCPRVTTVVFRISVR
jgi:hypothetical protein